MRVRRWMREFKVSLLIKEAIGKICKRYSVTLIDETNKICGEADDTDASNVTPFLCQGTRDGECF